ncbi:MAG: DUF4157 domain-containing protein [Bacteroidota bacterium]
MQRSKVKDESKIRRPAGAVTRSNQGDTDSFQFTDKRPEATKHRVYQAMANLATQDHNWGASAYKLVDNRPEAITQLKHQEEANNSSQVKRILQFQSRAQQYLQGESAVQFQTMANNFTATQQVIQKKTSAEANKSDNNTGLPDQLKLGVENLSGLSMDDVKVHYNSEKPAKLNAHAYAQGTNIHLASGQEKHLAHEAWHVVQQKQGRVRPTIQMKGNAGINLDRGLEREADQMGEKVFRESEHSNKPRSLDQKSLSSDNAPIQGYLFYDWDTTKLYDENGLEPKGKILTRRNGMYFITNDPIPFTFGTWEPYIFPVASQTSNQQTPYAFQTSAIEETAGQGYSGGGYTAPAPAPSALAQERGQSYGYQQAASSAMAQGQSQYYGFQQSAPSSAAQNPNPAYYQQESGYSTPALPAMTESPVQSPPYAQQAPQQAGYGGPAYGQQGASSMLQSPTQSPPYVQQAPPQYYGGGSGGYGMATPSAPTMSQSPRQSSPYVQQAPPQYYGGGSAGYAMATPSAPPMSQSPGQSSPYVQQAPPQYYEGGSVGYAMAAPGNLSRLRSPRQSSPYLQQAPSPLGYGSSPYGQQMGVAPAPLRGGGYGSSWYGQQMGVAASQPQHDRSPSKMRGSASYPSAKDARHSPYPKEAGYSGLQPSHPGTSGKRQRKHPRTKIDIGPNRYKRSHKSSVPEHAIDPSTLGEWTGLKTDTFYAKTRELLKIARNDQHPKNQEAIGKLDALVNAYNQFPEIKEMIHKYIRVRATKKPGMASGAGLDELFKTSQTMKYLEWSYRPPPGMQAVASYKGEEFDWMDAQQNIRLSTELIIWAGDLVGEISGHTGSLQNQYKGVWMTSKQALMHELRDEAISKRTNPASAIIEAIFTHLRITVDLEEFLNSDIFMGEAAKKALTTSGRSIRASYNKIAEAINRNRGKLKMLYHHFQQHLTAPAGSSPLRGRTSQGYADVSPQRSGDATSPIRPNQRKKPGNVLPYVPPQVRVNYGGEAAIPIPQKPQHPTLKLAKATLRAQLKKKGNSIVNKAKRFIKKEELSGDNADIATANIYINELQALPKPNTKTPYNLAAYNTVMQLIPELTNVLYEPN